MIAVDDRLLPEAKFGNGMVAIDQNSIGLNSKRVDRATHRQECGLQNIDLIYSFVVDYADTPQAVRSDKAFPLEFPSAGRKALRVIQAVDFETAAKDDCGGDHGAGQGAAPGFIDTANKRRGEIGDVKNRRL